MVEISIRLPPQDETDIGGGATFYDIRVEVEPVEPVEPEPAL